MYNILMYLLAITLSLCFLYGILYALLPLFFKNKFVKISPRSLLSLLIIFTLSILGYIVVFSIPQPEIGNRVLHGFGGGYMAILVCFLVVKDTNIQLRKFQFLSFSLAVVALLGVANEILEFFLQNYAGWIFVESINDTWYDLISNTVGSLIATLFFLPFINRMKMSEKVGDAS